jgi:hypothetical protein
VEVVLGPDIVTALNGSMYVRGARWTGVEETTSREGEDLPVELRFALHKPRRSTIPLLSRSCYWHSVAVAHFAGEERVGHDFLCERPLVMDKASSWINRSKWLTIFLHACEMYETEEGGLYMQKLLRTAVEVAQTWSDNDKELWEGTNSEVTW